MASSATARPPSSSQHTASASIATSPATAHSTTSSCKSPVLTAATACAYGWKRSDPCAKCGSTATAWAKPSLHPTQRSLLAIAPVSEPQPDQLANGFRATALTTRRIDPAQQIRLQPHTNQRARLLGALALDVATLA